MKTLPIILLICSCVFVSSAADMNQMEHGPFISWTIRGQTITHKGIAIRVGSEPPAMICFDTDLMRVSEAWTGGLLTWYPQRDGLERNPAPNGKVQFMNDVGPGWAIGESLQDPRRQPYSPLPQAHAHFRGLHVNGDRVVLAYSVGENSLLEMPSFGRIGGAEVFTRTFDLDRVASPLMLRVCKVLPGTTISIQKNVSPQKNLAVLSVGETNRVVWVNGVPAESTWQLSSNHLWLRLPAAAESVRFTLSIGPETKADPDSISTFTNQLAQETASPDLTRYCQPGPARWNPPLVTQATMASNDAALVVDSLTLPEKNPWNSWIRCSGFDFLPDGRVVMASVSGDVWLVSGIAETLGELKWKRFATGMYQPLGVKVVDGEIFVTCRDQIHRLHDRNGDDEVDFYENFNNGTFVAENFHEYTMNLETDSSGNFYFTKGAPWPPDVKTPHAGVLFKLSKDGKHLETFATGLRGPNGLAIGPDDVMTFSDNEGHWVPTCTLHLVKQGGFYGMKPTAHRDQVPENFEQPICWIPHAIDNSPGGQVWVPKHAWGPLAGHMLLTSYGKSTLSLLLMETVHGRAQGGLVRLPLRFDSGIIRGRFSAADGHLYVCGLRVWQSTGTRYGAFHRVRYTGKPTYTPIELHAKPGGLEVKFSCPLDPKYSTDAQDYSVEVWNYRWIERYGSPHYSVKNPDRVGHDQWTIRAVRLSEDRTTVWLEIPEMQPVMQMQISYNIRGADGTELTQTIYNTVHALR